MLTLEQIKEKYINKYFEFVFASYSQNLAEYRIETNDKYEDIRIDFKLSEIDEVSPGNWYHWDDITIKDPIRVTKYIRNQKEWEVIYTREERASKLKDADPGISAALEEFSKTTGKTERTISVPKKEEEKG